MDRARHQLFAGATLTGDQNICAAGRNLLDQVIDFFDSTAFTDHAFKVKLGVIPRR